MAKLIHDFPFDPSYGYDAAALRQVGAPPEPEGFTRFWQELYWKAREVSPKPEIRDAGQFGDKWRIFDIYYTSTQGARIGGWLLLPLNEAPRRGFVITHGYGGREAPDEKPLFSDAAILYPCLRGFHRSEQPGVPNECYAHVVHGIEDPHTYLLGRCVEDVWLAISALLRLFPELNGHLGYLGGSFGGGIGALALPWEERVQRAHLAVPTFGNQPLRLQLPTVGSGHAVIEHHRRHPEHTQRTLAFFDSAIAARHLKIPVHCACARFDPAVAPPGQYAVYNNLAGPKALYEHTAGHFEYPELVAELEESAAQVVDFFAPLCRNS